MSVRKDPIIYCTCIKKAPNPGNNNNSPIFNKGLPADSSEQHETSVENKTVSLITRTLPLNSNLADRFAILSTAIVRLYRPDGSALFARALKACLFQNHSMNEYAASIGKIFLFESLASIFIIIFFPRILKGREHAKKNYSKH